MPTTITRRGTIGAGLAAVSAAVLPGRARAQAKPIRIGVLTDMSGPYAANTGPGSVAASRMAVEDFTKAHPEVKVELLSADMQDKPNVAVDIATDWLDNRGVDLITDLPLSSAALAVGHMVDQRDKLAIFTGAASAEITGTACGPNHLHWVLDTWSMPHAVVDAILKEGGKTWFFITADYTFGHSLESDFGGVRQRRRRQGAGPGADSVPRNHRFFGAAGAGARQWRQRARARQRRVGYCQLHQAGRRVRHHEGRHEGRRPDLSAARRPRPRPASRAGRAADRCFLLEPERQHARVRPPLRPAYGRRDAELRSGRPVFGDHQLPERCRRRRHRQG